MGNQKRPLRSCTYDSGKILFQFIALDGIARELEILN